MIEPKTHPSWPEDLPQRAEVIVREKAACSAANIEPLSLEETRRTLHELQVHPIELEPQNEELREAQVALDDKQASLDASDDQKIRQLFDEYLRMYSARDDRLTTYFSEDFSGFTGGGNFLVKDKAEWVAITRQDFDQIKDPIHIELKDLAVQSLAETIAVATGFFSIHLPIKDHILSRETARLVLIFRKESAGWKISHSSISIPYHLVREGEIYPLKELVDRNQFLEKLVAERTDQLSETNRRLQRTNEELAREIVEHQRSAAALRQREVELKGILDTTADGILAIDSHGKVIRSNRRFAQLWGIPPALMESGDDQQLLDFVLHQLAEPEAFLKKVQAINDSIKEDTDTLAFKDGRIFEHCSAPLMMESSLVGRLWSFSDITERKQMEAARAKLEAQNRQLQKTESLGRMAGAIAHHFNNQLQAVMMNLEMAMTNLPGNAGTAGILTEAMQSARKAAQVSSSMLTYLGQTVAKREPMDLSDACQRYLPMLRAGMPQSVALMSNFPSPGPTISGANANQIQQVRNHLVTNAWEAIGDARGIIRLTFKKVSVTEVHATHRFPTDWKPHDPAYICLEVMHTGCGIPVGEFEKLFDPFFIEQVYRSGARPTGRSRHRAGTRGGHHGGKRTGARERFPGLPADLDRSGTPKAGPHGSSPANGRERHGAGGR